MNVESLGVSAVQWAEALPGAILLLLGAAVTLCWASARGWGVLSSSDPDPSPLPRLSPVLISLSEPRARRRSGYSASMSSRAPPGSVADSAAVPPRLCPAAPAHAAAADDDPNSG